MTPAEKPNEAPKTRREAIMTRLGKKTTAAPKPVEAPAPKTKQMATITFFSTILVVVVV